MNAVSMLVRRRFASTASYVINGRQRRILSPQSNSFVNEHFSNAGLSQDTLESRRSFANRNKFLKRNKWCQRQQLRVWRVAEELMKVGQMPGIGQADEEPAGSPLHHPVERHPQHQPGAATGAVGRDRRHDQRRWPGRIVQCRIRRMNAFEDDRRDYRRIKPVDDRSLACAGSPAGYQRAGDQPPRLASLPGSTPSCLSLRYRWVRSRPVFSATRVMLPPSRTR